MQSLPRRILLPVPGEEVVGAPFDPRAALPIPVYGVRDAGISFLRHQSDRITPGPLSSSSALLPGRNRREKAQATWCGFYFDICPSLFNVLPVPSGGGVADAVAETSPLSFICRN